MVVTARVSSVTVLWKVIAAFVAARERVVLEEQTIYTVNVVFNYRAQR